MNDAQPARETNRLLIVVCEEIVCERNRIKNVFFITYSCIGFFLSFARVHNFIILLQHKKRCVLQTRVILNHFSQIYFT